MEAKKLVTVAQATLGRLIGMLMRGELKPGGKLPPEDDLAAMLDVSSGTLKDVLKVLAVLGVVEVHRGQGYVVATKSTEAMLNPLLIGLLLEHGSRQDLFELRVLMEVGALELAVLKATDDDLRALADNLRKYEGRMVEGDHESLAELDRLFHQQILDMSRNPLFIKLGSTISQLFTLPLSRALGAWGPEQILSNHRAVYEAVQSRDVEEARRLVTRAFERTKEFF